MKPATAKMLSKVLSGISFVFVFAAAKLVVGSMETPQELRKK
ncbi:hypothetical protein J31TS6_57260 [Brevibacillus reuszeri]|nr:hypothetical protein [Brevibacillus reuszeri]GIO09698.1 hypothetical protein J31TS6_57260 [Brevibacillus reuszeri]